MRLWAVFLVIFMLFAGCTEPVMQPASTGSPTPTSTRDSRDPKDGLRASDVSQDVDDYDFYFLQQFQVRLPPGPTDQRPPPKTFWLGGNESLIRVNTTFFLNTARPVHSGTGFGANILGILLTGTPPAMVGVWKDGTQLVRHTTPTGFAIQSPFPGGYRAMGPTKVNIVPAKYLAMEAGFTSTGWGDIYAEVVLYEAVARNMTKLGGPKA